MLRSICGCTELRSICGLSHPDRERALPLHEAQSARIEEALRGTKAASRSLEVAVESGARIPARILCSLLSALGM